MNTATTNKMHPHKFALWIGLASIVMMFAGLTSAYIVKRGQSDWMAFTLPVAFGFSTFIILLSSASMWLTTKALKARNAVGYKMLMTVTVFLGVLFMFLQLNGFASLQLRGVQLFGIGSNPSASFLGVITGLHILHVLGGIVALLIVFGRTLFFSQGIKKDVKALEIVGIYWHFVDLLWLYLFIFFNGML